MKKIWVIVILALTVMMTGCSSQDEITEGTTFYVGQSESWLATYSTSKTDNTYYNSLTIQYLFGNDGMKEVGLIEFEVVGKDQSFGTSYPQELQGVGNFHTGSILNAESIQINLEDELTLTISW